MYIVVLQISFYMHRSAQVHPLYFKILASLGKRLSNHDYGLYSFNPIGLEPIYFSVASFKALVFFIAATEVTTMPLWYALPVYVIENNHMPYWMQLMYMLLFNALIHTGNMYIVP